MPRSSPMSMRWSGKGRRRRLRIGRRASTTSGYCHVRKPRLVYGIGAPLLLITTSNWLTNRHRRADRRDAVLIEAFDRHPAHTRFALKQHRLYKPQRGLEVNRI